MTGSELAGKKQDEPPSKMMNNNNINKDLNNNNQAPRTRKSRAAEHSKMQKSVLETSRMKSTNTSTMKSSEAASEMSKMKSPAGSLMKAPDAQNMIVKSPDTITKDATEEEGGRRTPSTLRLGGRQEPRRKPSRISADESVDETEMKKKAGSREFLVNSIPRTHFHTVFITFELEEPNTEIDVTFSHSMVVRTIGRSSPLFSYLTVGDQVLEVNDTVVMTQDEFAEQIVSTTRKTKLTIIRPWNVHHCNERIPNKFRKDSGYSLIQVHQISGMRNGFELKQSHKKCVVTRAPGGTRGGYAFFKNDRILDVDSQNVATMDIQAVRKRFNATLKKNGVCSFLVERDLTIISSPNPSLRSARAVNAQEPAMGDDASEIGAREATRVLFMKSRYKPQSIVRDAKNQTTVDATVDTEDETKGDGKKKKRKRRKKLVSIEGKNEVSKVPSDVKDPTVLQKVTSKSGLLAFVRTYFLK